MSKQLLTKWTTPIAQTLDTRSVNVAAEMLEEVMAHPNIMKDVKVGSLRISDCMEEFPICTSYIQNVLRPEVDMYVRGAFSHTPKNLRWSAWVHTCLNGNGLVPHYHMGDEHITSIFYLTESKAGLFIRNPLANMIRNWPQEILTGPHMRDICIDPRPGKFVAFPTYLDHYVMAAEPDFRVSIAIDWCFE
jgi:Putative 2OG-Fe(II) oxygenase